jgi:predicted nucleic acid-binding protein
MSVVFLDTVGLIALWDRTDQWREAAVQAMARLDTPGARLVTTPLNMLECGNAAARKPYRSDVDLLRRKLERKGDLIIPTDADIAQGWAAYARGGATDAGIVDHISFIMRRLGIADALTNDRHFKIAGFNTLF